MAKRKAYKATHCLQLYDNEIKGVPQGLRFFHYVKTGHKWVHLIETATQEKKKCDAKLWKESTSLAGRKNRRA